METTNQFSWIGFYTAFATKLLEYKNDRNAIIRKIQASFEHLGLNVPKLEADHTLKDIDPFTIYGLFNKTSWKEENRKAIIGEFIKEFSVNAEIPETLYGIPLVNVQRAAFYGFEPRGEHDIDNLWETFEAALRLADNDNTEDRDRFCVAYNQVIRQPIVSWGLTSALFWIRPYHYLSLDSRNQSYMRDPSHISADVAADIAALRSVPSAEKYLELRDRCAAIFASGKYEYKTFPELSAKAWLVSEEAKRQEKAAEKASDKKARGDVNANTEHYWLFTPGSTSSKWDEFFSRGIMAIGWGELGNLREYTNEGEMQKKLQRTRGGDASFKLSAHEAWQFVHDLKQGDIVYVKQGQTKILGRGVVESDYQFAETNQDGYPHVRSVKWTHKGTWNIEQMLPAMNLEILPPHILTDITSYTGVVNGIKSLFDTRADIECREGEEIPGTQCYTKEDFLKEAYMDEEKYDTLVGVFRNKKNIILQGAPGVGKTYIARRLAYSMMGVKDTERVMMIQFHQSYSYEDFIMGYRPKDDGFELKTGPFYKFCKRAEGDQGKDYFFIIDEINRGNLSKIFGELFMLVENDKRGIPIRLLYDDETFNIPPNVYLIGMMNTADRSLAMLDYALRRRFAFFDLKPAFASEGFRKYREALDSRKFDALIQCVENLNRQIASDESLGEGFCIGHSFFCNYTPDALNTGTLSAIVEYELIPLLKEYWFDEPGKIDDWSGRLRDSIR